MSLSAGYASRAFWGGDWKRKSVRESGSEARTRDGITVEQSICMTEPLLRRNISQAAAKTTTFQLHPVLSGCDPAFPLSADGDDGRVKTMSGGCAGSLAGSRMVVV